MVGTMDFAKQIEIRVTCHPYSKLTFFKFSDAVVNYKLPRFFVWKYVSFYVVVDMSQKIVFSKDIHDVAYNPRAF